MRTIWAFSAAVGWKQIEDFLVTAEANDGQTERTLAGFRAFPGLSVGDDETGSFRVSVFARSGDGTQEKAPEYRFLVRIEVADTEDYVAVEGLPDVLELLRQTAPLAASIDAAAIKRDKYTKQIEKELEKGSFRSRKRG